MKKHARAVHHERVQDHAKSLIHATAHIADSKVAEAREKLSEVIESAKEAFEYVEERAVETAKRTDEYIRDNPYQAVAIGMGIGVLLGIVIARRK